MIQKDCDERKDMVRISVSIPRNTYNELRDLAKEFDVSIASVMRLATENRLKEYLGTIRYIDSEQGEKILDTALDVSDNCRKILNNVKRIGVNYNQELKLKNAESKYHSVLRSSTASYARRAEAKDEYDKVKSEIDDTSLNKTELYNLLSQFEAAADKMKELTWLIQG